MLELFDFIGIFAFSLSGFLAAKKKDFDIFGIFIISFITALGGGFIRDISINEIPFIFKENYPLIIVISSIIFAFLIRPHLSKIEQLKIFLIADSIGLISFSINGALIAQEHNLNFTGFIFLSLFSAIGGGVLRDILLKRKITVFTEDIYASLSLITGIIIFFYNSINIYFLFTLLLILRLFIINKKLSLPTIK